MFAQGSLSLSRIVGFTRVRAGCRWVRWGSLGSSGVVGSRWVHVESWGSLWLALVVVGFIRRRCVRSDSP